MSHPKTNVSKKKELQLPVNRIRTIMKSSPNVETISQDSLHLVTKCTEMFIQYLSIQGLSASTTKAKLDYKGISTFVAATPELAFLAEILPAKLTVKECREILARQNEMKLYETPEDSADEE